MSAYVQPAVLANMAKLNRSWVTKATQLGLVNSSTLDGEDLIVVRVFAFVDQLVWPGRKRSRSEARAMEPWQSLAVNAARAAARDSATRMDSILWITPEGVAVTNDFGAHSTFVLEHQRSNFVAVPIGEWIAELPPNLETIFHWPRRIQEAAITVHDTAIALLAFSTIPQQVTVFATSDKAIEDAAYEKVRQHTSAQHPDSAIRIIERRTNEAQSPWFELYDLPGGGLVRRPVDETSLLNEYGPQLKKFGHRPDREAT
ncbi:MULTISPECIES: hypothetical protein [unclassified Streptomyces]|uniref:hypothetical protein n=1 Tax=unclassified Streptomyces TaxID=2593676 RepID=UPI00081F4C52|nr:MULTISPECIES: hypothetical protein [unclassified Streptomyces]MYZ36647.1 hypothetical protein [Streptomyces sp. SID4917]SCF85157.1 hypothetical protein GA0115259_103614 [Streptomyces sp. MnatMP-M17]